MPTTTTRLALPYPTATDPADVPADMQALAVKLDPATAVFLQGTAATRPAAGLAGRFHCATDTGALTYDTGSAWISTAAAGNLPPLVTSLPSSPSDGQEVYYQADAANGVIWNLRYRTAAPGAYKWEFVGGPPLLAGAFAVVSTTSGTPVALAGGPSITLPLAGDYTAELVVSAFNGTATTISYTQLFVGGTASGGVPTASIAVPATNYTSVSAFGRHPAATAAAVAELRYMVSGGTCNYTNRILKMTPVRLG